VTFFLAWLNKSPGDSGLQQDAQIQQAETATEWWNETSANTETAYRALSVNWFRYSPIMQLFKELSVSGYKVIITTDHGTVQVNKPIKVIGDRNTSTNLRYKVGKALNYNKNEVFDITNPQKAMLPSPNVSSTYIFAKNRNFMAYPNNFNYYATYFKDSFQHGGISIEEMIVPLAVLQGKQ